MAITYVQGAGNTGHTVSSVAAAFTSANAAGNLILVCIGGWNAGLIGTLSVSDSQGNSYSLIQHDTGALGSSAVSVWYAQNVKAGANTVTVSLTGGSGASDLDLIVAEYSGLSTTAALTASSIAQTGNTTTSASAIAPANPNDALILYSYDQTNSGDTFTFTCSPSETLTPREGTSNTGGGESSSLVDSIGTFTGVTITPTVAISAGHSNALYLAAILLTDGSSGGFQGPELTLTGKWSITSASQTREAGFGTAPFTYAATGLPPGLTLDASAGTLTGTVSGPGSWTFTATATDANGKTVSVAVTASISAVPVDTSVCAGILSFGWA